jgi:O-acetyl-ADP-ribose deacetylase (regulator of RNase III)
MRVYRPGKSDLALRFGDITTSKAQVLASSDDYFLSMGGGVSAKIRMAGGNTISLDAAKQIPLRVGDIAITTAGTLPARFIFHAVTLGPGGATTSTEEIIRETTARCLALLKPLGVSSIAFPAIYLYDRFGQMEPLDYIKFSKSLPDEHPLLPTAS